MNSTAWGAIATLAIFVLSNIAALIYWSARISTLLDVVQRQLGELNAEFKALHSTYVSKEDLAYRVASSDKEHETFDRRLAALERRD